VSSRRLCYPTLVSEHAPVTEREPVTPEAPPAPDAEPPRPPLAPRLRRDAGFFFIAITVVLLDQVTKAIVRQNLDLGEAWPDPDWILNIVYVTNSGAAFGILQGQTLFLVVTSLVGVAAIMLYYLYPPLEHGLLRAALGLQLGGAAGNLIDRVRFGEVTDFINFSFWPAFNVSDASISIGVVTILWFFLTMESERLRDPHNADAARD
jgi:signal peptidase II